MDFKRLNKDSSLKIIDMKTTSTGELTNILNEIEQNGIVLQMCVNQMCDTMLIEYLPTIEHESTVTWKDGGNMEFENSLDTIINNDPFGAKYSGHTIREIFEKGDRQWIDTALSKMHNQFIVNKIKYILERGGYGKILC